MARRSSGEGSIYPVRDKQGNVIRWASSITIWQDGKAKRKKVERKLKRDVVIELARLQRQVERGMDVLEKPQTLKDFLPAWLEDDYALKHRKNSIAAYRYAIDKLILPTLGSVILPKLTHQRAQQWVNALVKAGRPAKTIRLAVACLTGALKTAKRWKLVSEIVTEGLTMPSIPATTVEALTPEQCRALLERAKGERLEVALRLTLSLGLRRGETCGLHWSDYNEKTGELTINGTLSDEGDYGETKTPKGRRTIKLPAALQAALRWWKGQQDKEFALMEWEAPAYIFTSTRTGGALRPDTLADAFKRIAKRAGLPDGAHIHMLRHSCASFLIAQGVPITVVSAALGHASVAVTAAVYAHLLPGQIDVAVEQVEALIAKTGT